MWTAPDGTVFGEEPGPSAAAFMADHFVSVDNAPGCIAELAAQAGPPQVQPGVRWVTARRNGLIVACAVLREGPHPSTVPVSQWGPAEYQGIGYGSTVDDPDLWALIQRAWIREMDWTGTHVMAVHGGPQHKYASVYESLLGAGNVEWQDAGASVPVPAGITLSMPAKFMAVYVPESIVQECRAD